MKQLETHKYPCWITRDQNGTLKVWRGKGKQHTDDLPQKPKRLRPGTQVVMRAGYIGIGGPVIEEGEGRWTIDDYQDTQVFGFSPKTAKTYFPEVTWESEPVKGHVCFNIEID